MASPRTLRDLSLRPVSVLEKVSARKAAQLEQWGVESVLDLLTTYPRRYIDRTKKADVSGLEVGSEAAILAEVQRVRSRPGHNRRAPVTITVRDDTGAMDVVFFNQPWRAKQLAEGTEAIFWGKVGDYRGTRQMVNPVVDVVAGVDAPAMGQQRRTLRILPIYPASAKAGLTSWEIGTFVEEALARAGEFVDPLDAAWRTSLDLWDRTAAMRAVHGPESSDVIAPARRRLIFDELFRLQLALVLRRRAFEHNARALRHDVSPREITGAVSGTLVARFLAALPFELTTAQRRTLAVIVADLAGPFPMHRLLQGDVGSGKTVVALAALLGAVQSGHQGALMVPTEVLAEQHAVAVRQLLGDLDVRVELLTSRVKGKARAKMLEDLAERRHRDRGGHPCPPHPRGRVQIAGHGGDRRAAPFRGGAAGDAAGQGRGGGPRSSGHDGDAHPAHGRHGDLRRPRPHRARRDAPGAGGDHHIVAPRPGRRAPGVGEGAAEVAAGHRAFVVCPLVGDSPRVEARSATEERTRLEAGELAGLRVGLLHGQMAPAAREEAMAQFRRGEIEVLVATTVIEVGVDVPEATVMVIESADRFGIAQLHQLRGRVGRGARPSWCFLLGAGGEDGLASERLAAVARTTDGFALAEDDLRLRGEGTLLGARQQGQSDLRLASLSDPDDRLLLTEARRVAEVIVGEDPQLEAHEALADEIRLFLSEDEGEYLFKS